MALGDQSKALIIMSRNQGFDPTRIYESDGKTPAKFPTLPDGGQGLSNFDRVPGVVTHRTTGKLPGGLGDAAGNFPALESRDNPILKDTPSVPWNHGGKRQGGRP